MRRWPFRPIRSALELPLATGSYWPFSDAEPSDSHINNRLRFMPCASGYATRNTLSLQPRHRDFWTLLLDPSGQPPCFAIDEHLNGLCARQRIGRRGCLRARCSLPYRALSCAMRQLRCQLPTALPTLDSGKSDLGMCRSWHRHPRSPHAHKKRERCGCLPMR